MSEHPGGRPTSHSRVTLSRIMNATDVNLYGTVHGGVLMKFVDDVAGAAAARHSGGTAVTAAIDEIVFVEPVRVGGRRCGRPSASGPARIAGRTGGQAPFPGGSDPAGTPPGPAHSHPKGQS